MNWLPGVPLGLFGIFKVCLFLLLFFLVLTTSSLNSPSRFLSISGLLLVMVLSSYAFFNAFNETAAYEALKDISLPFIFVLVIYNYPGDNGQLLKILYSTALVISLICFFSLLSYVTKVFNFTPPLPFKDKFSETAFGGYRTGWSNSIFLFVPFILYYNLRNFGRVKILGVCMVLSIMASQFICGGRGGLLSSLFCVGILAIRKASIFLPLAIILLVIYFYLPEELIIEKFRTAPEVVTRGKNIKFVSEEEYMDGLTSHRLSGYKIGLQLFLESPIIGFGFGQSDSLSDELGYGPDIHNVWLKRVIEGGLVLLLVLMYMFYSIYTTVMSKIGSQAISDPVNNRNLKYFFYTLFFLSIGISMLEPNYLIGSIQGEATFWIYLGFLSREHLNQ